MALHDKLKTKVTEWCASKYESDYPAISEILDYNYDSETQSLRYLRWAQFEALENYWYLRLQEGILHALAMGAGKTVLIGTIIATEFAMALENPDGPLINNASVFAPGKTLLGALKEPSDVPYEKIRI